MEKFKVVYQDEKEIWFRLMINKDIVISFEVLTNGTWKYIARKSRWNTFSLRNGEFQITNLGTDETLTLQEFMLINNGFHELMRQLKEDLSYRLKIMHLLNDENRKVWDKV